jgi:hypothetical protein
MARKGVKHDCSPKRPRVPADISALREYGTIIAKDILHAQGAKRKEDMTRNAARRQAAKSGLGKTGKPTGAKK